MTYTSTKKKHILVCDDDPEITEVISKTLEMNPRYEVVSFGSGKEVLHYLNGDASALPDLLILDLWLPDIDSDEIIPMLRKNPVTRDIPIILISAIVNVEVVAREVGAESYLSKPFLLEELEYKVEQLVN